MALPASTLDQPAMLATGMLLGAGAVVLHALDRDKPALALLTLAALLLRLWSALLDPFLNDWDEVYHAVVARNLWEHPLSPMLYKEPALPIATLWDKQHIWLHKPPFFLWQMAVSIGLFGAEPWAVRIPSVLWSTLLVPVVWRMGVLLRGPRTGFMAAAMVSFSYLLQELTGGGINTDHNDLVFIATIACASWAWLELVHQTAWWKAIAVGLFSAAAMLTKWYVGALVFLPWAIWILLCRRQRTAILHLVAGALAMLLPVLAWLLHINRWFPQEAKHEWAFKAQHFGVPMDGHTGDGRYHLDRIAELVPPFSWWLLLIAVVVFAVRATSPAHRIWVLSGCVSVHVFFALAATKMPCYTMVLLPIYLLAVADALHGLCSLAPGPCASRVLRAAVTLLLCWCGLDVARTFARRSEEHTDSHDPRWRQQNIAWQQEMHILWAIVSCSERPLVYHVPRNQHLRFMYRYGVDTWRALLDTPTVERLQTLGYTVYALQDGEDPSAFPAGVVLVPDSVLRIGTAVRL